MSTPPGSNPHDRLFRFAFEDIDIARAELKAVLPTELLEQLVLERLEVDKRDLPEADLSDRFCDVLYRVPGKDGTPRFVWLLLEHQSTNSPLMALRLLEYMVRIWAKLVRSEAPPQKLPVIWPVVLAHDPAGWTAPTRFRDLLDAGPEVDSARPSVPDFEYLVDDLTRIGPREVAARSESPAYRLVLWALQSRCRVSADKKGDWTEAFKAAWGAQPGSDIVKAVIHYAMRVAGKQESVALEAAVAADSQMEQIVTSYAEELFREGQATGRVAGEAEVLLQQLAWKFEFVPPELESQVRAADSEQILTWAKRILDATSLEDIFKE